MSHSGVMVALYPPAEIASSLAIKGGTAAEDLHLTLAYFGDKDELKDQKVKLIRATANIADMQNGALSGRISGLGRFNNDEGQGTNALYASFDSPQLPAFHARLRNELEHWGDIKPSTKHGFTPHITLSHIETSKRTPDIRLPVYEVEFDSIYLVWGDERTRFPFNKPPEFSVFKDANDEYRWLLISSSAYRDRDKEIVSIAAQTKDIAQADADGRYGPLRWWHVGGHDPKAWQDPKGEPWGHGLDLGWCDYSELFGPFRIESGTFISPSVALAIKSVAPSLAVSLGFHYPENEPDDNGIYHNIRTFERSLLPKEKASNLYTAIQIKEAGMALTEQLRKKAEKLAGLIGDENAMLKIFDQAIAGAGQAAASGVDYKEAKAKTEAKPQENLTIESLESAFKAFGEALMAKQAEKEKVANEAIKALRAELKEAQAQLKELQGGQPPAIKQGHRASQSADSIVDPAVAAALKAVQGNGGGISYSQNPHAWAYSLVDSLDGRG